MAYTVDIVATKGKRMRDEKRQRTFETVEEAIKYGTEQTHRGHALWYTIEDTVSGKQVYNTMNGTGDIADLTKRYHGEPCRHERK